MQTQTWEVGEAETLPAFGADSPAATRVVPAHTCQIPRNPDGTLLARAAARITHVVVHVLQGHYAHAIQSWQRGTACFKPHYVISHAGEITQVVPERHLAQHANRANGFSIGIEHDGFATDPAQFTEAMYASSANLVRDICIRYGIPVDRTRIIGHDEAPGTSHGDPGGYWDWDYYLALVGWSGNMASRPIRALVDYTSYSFWPTSEDWAAVGRGSVRHAPHPEHGWGPRHYRVAPTATDRPAVFIADAPAGGTYQVSAWWPVLASNNPAVTMRVMVGGNPIPAITVQVDQSTRRGRVRRTLALPNTPVWYPLGAIKVRAGEAVSVEVSSQSTRRGWIVADAIRLFRR
jgi:hypothetical protein